MTEARSDTLDRPAGALDALTEANAVANLAVRDLGVARSFYEGILGFQPTAAEGDEAIVYRSGDSIFFVYRSEFAGTNRATAVTWGVGDRIEAVAAALVAKGIEFEHYDMPDMRREGDIYVAGNFRIAWFKDPDGNILNIVSG
jgi:catechol 2,3-dioxygenase-like lactoylglutathione lyase family enzyme